jgi:hypothetical protein
MSAIDLNKMCDPLGEIMGGRHGLGSEIAKPQLCKLPFSLSRFPWPIFFG